MLVYIVYTCLGLIVSSFGSCVVIVAMICVLFVYVLLGIPHLECIMVLS